ncbi:MAG: hypothetical protein ACOYON_10175 [Fimbriimonas sp.]
MRKTLISLVSLFVVALVGVGCGSGGDAPKDDSKLKEQVKGDNSKMDMSKVPEKDRAMVEKMMQGGGNPAGK